MAPPFLEKTLIALATSHDSFAQGRAIPALGRLNTAESKRVLAKLIEDRQPKYSWQAIDALARTHDRSYLPLLEKLAKDPAWQNLVIPALGELGGRSVIWFLAPLVYYPLGPPNKPLIQQLAIRGLASTGSREAIPYLIQPLRNLLVEQDAVNNLEQLTRYVIFQKGGATGSTPKMTEPLRKWRNAGSDGGSRRGKRQNSMVLMIAQARANRSLCNE